MGVGPKPLVLGGTTAVLGTAGTAAGGQLLHAGGGQHCRLRENHGCPHHHRQLWHPVLANIVAKLNPTKNLRNMDSSSISKLPVEPKQAPKVISTALGASDRLAGQPRHFQAYVGSSARSTRRVSESSGFSSFVGSLFRMCRLRGSRRVQSLEKSEEPASAPDRTPEPKPHSLHRLCKAQPGLGLL